jgi:hypothetical protein
MLEASTSGPAQLRHKTINAEVNLLSEWQRKRDEVVEQITRMAIALTLVALLALGSLPFLLRAFVASGARLADAQTTLNDKTLTASRLDMQKRSATPRLDQDAMHESVVREAKQFLGQTLLVMNAAEPGMAFQSVTASVVSGELTINCKADAETNAVVQNFMAHAKEGSSVHSYLLVNTQKNPVLGNDGVSFEYSKVVGVAP